MLAWALWLATVGCCAAGQLLVVVQQTMQPTRAWLWLQPSAGPRPPR